MPLQSRWFLDVYVYKGTPTMDHSSRWHMRTFAALHQDGDIARTHTLPFLFDAAFDVHGFSCPAGLACHHLPLHIARMRVLPFA